MDDSLGPAGIWGLRLAVIMSFLGIGLLLYAIKRRVGGADENTTVEIAFIGGGLLVLGLITLALIGVG